METFERDGRIWAFTRDHAMSSYGIPVLVDTDRKAAYGPDDFVLVRGHQVLARAIVWAAIGTGQLTPSQVADAQAWASQSPR